MPTVLETLLTGLPAGWRVTDLYVGANWLLSCLRHSSGEQRAAVASTPRSIPVNSRYPVGHYSPNANAEEFAHLLLSEDSVEAAVGLATLNALNQPPSGALSREDAADWLSVRCVGRAVAIFGRFPFIDAEIRPFARKLWVFEQDPHEGEYNRSSIETVLPSAELVAITGSSVINHTIDLILPHTASASLVVLLGPSTPLSEKLFSCGIDAMFGVRIAHLDQVIESVTSGEGFQKMRGLERVSLIRKRAG